MADCNKDKLISKFDKIIALLESETYVGEHKKEVGKLWAESSIEFLQCMGLPRKDIKKRKRQLRKMGL